MWLCAAVARFAFLFELRQALGVFLDWIPGFLLLAGGMVLAFAGFRRALDRRPRRPLRLLPSIGPVAVMLLLWGTPLGLRIGVASTLWRAESGYREVIEAIRDDPVAQPPDGGPPAVVEPGPPLRVAFPWGGLGDNWSAVVYDPGGSVLAANGPHGAPEIRALFGGTLIHAKHVWGPWYFCVFT